MSHIYLGYRTPAEFLAAADPTRQINLLVSRKPGQPGTHGIAVDRTILTMSQYKRIAGSPDAFEVIYFEAVIHRYQTLNGHQIMEGDEGKARRLATQAEQIARRWLRDQGALYQMAALAFPSDLITFEGDPTFLEYDRETESYSYHYPTKADPEPGSVEDIMASDGGPN